MTALAISLSLILLGELVIIAACLSMSRREVQKENKEIELRTDKTNERSE